MKILNRTDRPTKEIRRLIRYATRGLNAEHAVYEIRESRRRAWNGKRYASGHARKDWPAGHGRIVIRIPPDSEFPFEGWQRHKASPWNHDYHCWREALVALAAHEAKHIDIPTAYYQDNSKQVVEMNCEAYERHVLDAYRRTAPEGAVRHTKPSK